MRRRLSTFHTMRQPSANDGGGSSVMAASVTPMARRSCRPRTGSVRRRPSSTRMRVGMAKTKNGTRQLSQVASPPATTGPMKAPTALAPRWKENTRGRLPMGNQSASSELWVGPTVAWPMPEPPRTMASIHTEMASPVPTENMAKSAAPISMSRTRLRRSESWAMGTCSDRPSRAATATSDRMPALDMPKLSRMLGSRSPNAVRSISSTMLSPNRINRA